MKSSSEIKRGCVKRCTVYTFKTSCHSAIIFRMVEKLRPDELEAFKEAFDMFDRNMDGTISTKVGHKNSNCDNNDDNKTISDGGITVDFSIIKVHTSLIIE